jgi:hypothetical protein
MQATLQPKTESNGGVKVHSSSLAAEASLSTPQLHEQHTQDHSTHDDDDSGGGGGGLLIIKMDIEGAEYQVLKEIAASNVLCELITLGSKVVMIVEYHDKKAITDPKELKAEKMGIVQARRQLMACGVQFEKLPSDWK